MRFGWIDFIDDLEVSRALIDTVKAWGKERGMNEIEGPLGFTDMDAEGMLIEGFDQLSTMATIYNYPYYPEHMEKLGLVKSADWVEMKIYVPEEIPEKPTAASLKSSARNMGSTCASSPARKKCANLASAMKSSASSTKLTPPCLASRK